jgi:hypothetical protein
VEQGLPLFVTKARTRGMGDRTGAARQDAGWRIVTGEGTSADAGVTMPSTLRSPAEGWANDRGAAKAPACPLGCPTNLASEPQGQPVARVGASRRDAPVSPVRVVIESAGQRPFDHDLLQKVELCAKNFE